MSKLLKCKLSILFITALCCSSKIFAQAGASLLTDNKMQTKLDTAIDYAARIYLQDSNTKGMSIGVIYLKHNYTYNYGKSSLATADNFYNIGSVAKTFVTTILAQAVIDKRVSLQDDIRKFMQGSYPNLEYNGNPVRLVNLANHTSGLPTTFRTFSSSIQDSLKKLNITQQLHFYAMYNADSLLLDLHSVKPDTLPGTKFQYNSTAMKLLELLLEKIYQKPYEQIIREYCQAHLNMFDTKTFLTNDEITRAVQGHNGYGKPQTFLNLSGYYFGPAINTTINDMLKYIAVNLSDADKAIHLTHGITYGKDTGFAIGLGWMMDNDVNGKRYIYHDGNTKIGYNTLCIFYPNAGLGFIIIVNDTVSQDKVGETENNIKKMLNGN